MLTVIFNKKYKKSFKNLKSYVIIEKRVSLCPKLKAYLSCKHVKTLHTIYLKQSMKKGGCGECQTSCQSACKTSCTVGNQSCENK